ncbi:MAG: PD-(D/E)XK motif protein [Eubacterium sp.]|nr:PD-(D/E)XK motif protein [Eubacterium sp.]
MTVINEIREYFASLPMPGARKIENLPAEYPAYVIRIPDGYGVAIEVEDDKEVSEKFNNIKLHTGLISINGEMKNYLILRSAFEEFRYEFASVCAEFVEPGDSGSNRKMILADPYVWWTKWKELMGNTDRDLRVYNVIAEMMVLAHKYREDKSTEWTAARMGSHDIESAEESCEVKSTVKRYGASITISGQHQLAHFKRLYIYFCRLEESLEGVSINEMKKKLVADGYDEGKLEIELERQGFEKGANIRNKKYKPLEKRKYEVDDDFPKIVQESFKGNKYPNAITHIEYTIDLEGLDYTAW